MTNKRATKRALLTSVLAICLCLVMLIGSTFAWFTDTASTGVNKIQAGNLDVELLMRVGNGYTNIGDSTDPIFGSTSNVAQNNNQDTLWEPGKTQVAYLAVRNAGNLALKYNINLNVVDDGLAKALQYVIVPQGKQFGESQTCNATVESWADAQTKGGTAQPLPVGTVVAAPNGRLDEIAKGSQFSNETEYFALVVHMKEDAGNTYMNKTVTIDIQVQATQAAAESDSFNNTYDESATLPTFVSNQEELKDAIQNATDKKATITIPAGKTIALETGVANSANDDGKDRDITFVGDGSQTVDITTDAVGEGNNKLNYQRGSTFTFEKLNIVAADSGNFEGIVCDELTYKDCVITGKLTLYSKATFINCKFVNANDYCIWTWGGTDVTFEDCTFETGGKAILVYGGAEDSGHHVTNLIVNNCTFNDSNNGTKNKAAIETGNDYNATYTLTVNNATVNGFAARTSETDRPNLIATNSTLWANKDGMDKDHLSVTIDGVKVY